MKKIHQLSMKNLTFNLDIFHSEKLYIGYNRNIILLVIACLYFSCTKSDNLEVHISKTIIFEGRLYQMDVESPFSGKVFNTYASGKREYEGKYNIIILILYLIFENSVY